jgi:hypothetical protein
VDSTQSATNVGLRDQRGLNAAFTSAHGSLQLVVHYRFNSVAFFAQRNFQILPSLLLCLWHRLDK